MAILVRVKPGNRIREQGSTWVAGQTFWIDDDRFSSIADQVDKVEGVKPRIMNTALASPAPLFVNEGGDSGKMPVPDVRRMVPRQDPVKAKESQGGSKGKKK